MPALSSRSVALGLLVTAGCITHKADAADKLPAFNAAATQTSISGISSGAYMAVQFAIAWSSIIKGVGVVAGGPFGCSEGSAATALSTCMVGEPALDLTELLHRTDGWSRSGSIDPVTNITGQNIYLFSGYNDTVVARSVSDSLRSFYTHYLGHNTSRLFYQTAIGAGHSQVTLTYGNPCQDNGGEYINHCNYDQAGVILQHIYGSLAPPNRTSLQGQLLSFGQGEFTAPDSPNDNSMDTTGFAYVPAPCSAGEACRVHVALHGCLQSDSNIHEDFVKHAGYNEWADTNHIIVLYPQTHPSGANPQACWDWWGYLDPDPMVNPTYLLKSGKQISAIKRMIDRLTAGTATSLPASSTTPLVVADRSDTAIDLAWSALPDIQTYAIFRSEPTDPALHQIGTASGLSFADSKLQPATTYGYAIVPAGSSPPGAPALAATTLHKVAKCLDPGQCGVN
jgi:poly(3-hydroxybutyrate) depolymerase